MTNFDKVKPKLKEESLLQLNGLRSQRILPIHNVVKHVFHHDSINCMKEDTILKTRKEALQKIFQPNEEFSNIVQTKVNKKENFKIDTQTLLDFFDSAKLLQKHEEQLVKIQLTKDGYLKKKHRMTSQELQQYEEEIKEGEKKKTHYLKYKHTYLLQERMNKLAELGGILGLQNLLHTDIRNGLNITHQSEILQRQLYFGQNKQKPLDLKGLWEIFIEFCKIDVLFNSILIIQGINIFLLSIQQNRKTPYINYFVTIVVAVLKLFYKSILKLQYSKSLVDQQMSTQTKTTSMQKMFSVIRNGNNAIIDSADLLVGDIIIINQGDIIQSDGILTKLYNQESVTVHNPFEANNQNKKYTTDSNVKDSERDPFILSGTQIVLGQAEMMVLTVGMQTSSYRHFQKNLQVKKVLKEIEENMDEKNKEVMYDPFVHNLRKIIVKEGRGFITLILLLVAVQISQLVTNNYVQLYRDRKLDIVFKFDIPTIVTLLDFLLFGIILLIIMVPKSVIQILNLFMIKSIQNMRDKKDVLIEDYVSLYWLGQVNELIVDKTGCLTSSEMHVGGIFCELSEIENPQSKMDELEKKIGSKTRKLIIENICINSKGILIEQQKDDLIRTKKINFKDKHYSFQGSRTEAALLKFVMSKCDYQKIREQDKIKKVFQTQTNSQVKRMITLYHYGHKLRIYFRGTPEFILKLCTHRLDKLEREQPQLITEEYRARIAQISYHYGEELYMKLIVLAYKDFQFQNENAMNEFVSKINSEDDPNIMSKLIFIAIIGIQDPLRQESPSAIQTLTKAGINVRIFTGDNKEIASCVAKQCGLITGNEDGAVIDGDYLQKLIENENDRFKFKARRSHKPSSIFNSQVDSQLYNYNSTAHRDIISRELSKLKVLAKAQSKHKDILLQALKLYDRIVCVTGDDAENALAIEQAHIGVGLGGSETKTSIRIANVVLLNDSIQGIVESVAQSRTIFYAMKQIVYSYIITGINIYIFCLINAIFENGQQNLSVPVILMLSIIINITSLHCLLVMNPKLKQYMMKQKPCNQTIILFGRREKILIIFNCSLLAFEILILLLLGHIAYLNQISSGLIFLIHIETLCNQANSLYLKVFGIICGSGVLIVQWFLNSIIQNDTWWNLKFDIIEQFEYYLVGCIFANLNVTLSYYLDKKITTKDDRQNKHRQR